MMGEVDFVVVVIVFDVVCYEVLMVCLLVDNL